MNGSIESRKVGKVQLRLRFVDVKADESSDEGEVAAVTAVASNNKQAPGKQASIEEGALQTGQEQLR